MKSKNNKRLATVTLWITAIVWAGFGLFLGCLPDWLLETFQNAQATAAMRTEIRAFYGGVELGIAVTMVLLYFNDNLRQGLLVGGIPLLGSACGRLIGNWLDDFNPTHITLMSIELLGAVMCLAGAYLIRDSQSESRVLPRRGMSDSN